MVKAETRQPTRALMERSRIPDRLATGQAASPTARGALQTATRALGSRTLREFHGLRAVR